MSTVEILYAKLSTCFLQQFQRYIHAANSHQAVIVFIPWQKIGAAVPHDFLVNDCKMRRRFRMYIWKQWKKPRTKVNNLRKLGIPTDKAYQWGNSRLGYWRIAVVLYESVPLQTKDSQQRDTLVSSTTTSPCTYAVEPPCTGRYARWCERSAL